MAYVNNSEPGSALTKPNNVYVSLDGYNKNSIFGPPVSPIIPSMQYIQLPQEHENYGYESLSRDNDGVGYYSITSGYGNRCTSFNTAKCPRNEVIHRRGGPGPAPAPAPAPAVYEGFQMPGVRQHLEEIDLEVFVDTDKCPHTGSLLKMLQDADVLDVVEIKDIRDKKILDELIQKGGRGVPFIHSKSTGATVTGLPPHLKALIDSIRSQESKRSPSIVNTTISPDHQKIRDLKITIYVSNGCHFCHMYKEFLASAGLLPHVKIIDVNDKNALKGDTYLKTHNLPGYPFTYSEVTQTSFPGYVNSVKDIVFNLTNQTT